jgi:plastocyanin
MRRAHARFALAALAGAALAAAAACLSERQDATSPVLRGACNLPVDSTVIGRTHVVVAVRDFTFVPAEVRVAPGTTVTWVNCEPANIDPHTSTSDGGAWDSGFLRPGESYSRTFDEAGSFPYHCTPHPFMRGTIVIE